MILKIINAVDHMIIPNSMLINLSYDYLVFLFLKMKKKIKFSSYCNALGFAIGVLLLTTGFPDIARRILFLVTSEELREIT